MTLDRLGTETSLASLRARHAHSRWSFELDVFAAAGDLACTPRLVESTVAAPADLATGPGPYVVVIEGSLEVTGHLSLWTDDYRPGLVVVRGDLRARTLSFDNGARAVVEGSVFVEDCLFGDHGDRNGVLSVAGELRARALLLRHGARAYAGAGVSALIYAAEGTWEGLWPDIADEGVGDGAQFFAGAVLDRYGDLDFKRAIEAARAGHPLFLPGVEDAFPARPTARRT
ncbi:hypothetical protein [Nannocystis pusilla]|uniref:hypothetical protein n=1 Tax=Nannocystis pusilla TaxID=889268 RepID=UPI003DA347DE